MIRDGYLAGHFPAKSCAENAGQLVTDPYRSKT